MSPEQVLRSKIKKGRAKPHHDPCNPPSFPDPYPIISLAIYWGLCYIKRLKYPISRKKTIPGFS